MSSALKTKPDLTIHADSDEGWSLWRTVDAENTAEYVIASNEKTEQAIRIIKQSMIALLEGMSVGVILGDGEGEGRLAQTVMKRMSHLWSDCRMINRASGSLLVALFDDESHDEIIDQLIEIAIHQNKAGIRFVGYCDKVLPEVRFANLMADEGGADLELHYVNAGRMMLRMHMNTDAMTDGDVWERVSGVWSGMSAS
ncbi:hypothetical protein [Butyricicoccus sp. Marseille-Q5471]|uniref:hypothetical protein n=1 Tax=Butyricicoccus sp. Marseille-Q5471 TaxID=3039493 RepID=UPI0024BC7934|nr:hypothetical protein [Butyricicoccus sp. Marseille-Q5471]